MGLTIHYDIKYTGTPQQLQKKLEKIRSKCLDLPFETVGEVKKNRITQVHIDVYNLLHKILVYPHRSEENLKRGRLILQRLGITQPSVARQHDVYKWLKKIIYHRPENYIEIRDLILQKIGVSIWQMTGLGEWKEEGNKSWKEERPAIFIGLKLWPGEGCEPCDLRFYKYRSQKFFKCSSFCKTQYATHFARCHLLVIGLMDLLVSEGFDVYVIDEGNYWKTRDIKVLAKEINASTQMISAMFGELRSLVGKNGSTLESPIEKSKNYMVER